MSAPADLVWEAGRPYSRQFDDCYFSRHDGLAETRYVFIEHNRLPARFAALSAGERFTVGETGFGSGLNFLATWQCFEQHAPGDARLHYISVENHPLQGGDIVRTHQLWPELRAEVERLAAQYPPAAVDGFHRLTLSPRVELTLIFAEAAEGLRACLTQNPPGALVRQQGASWSGATGAGVAVDAWFLDGFAPAKNPDMWRPALFEAVAQLSRENATLATFTAAGDVRRGLAAAGFAVAKAAGYGRKRDMLTGRFERLPPAHAPPGEASWHLVEPAPAVRRVAVIGAGLAGCHTAAALARRGFAVDVYDAGAIASGASGNPQGILYCKLSHTAGPYADFNLSAYAYACRYYQSEGLFEALGDQCGTLQLAQDERTERQFAAIAERFRDSPDLLRLVTATQARELAGVALNHPGLYLPRAGWLAPAALCRRLLAQPGIRLYEHCAIDRLTFADDQWHLEAAGNPRWAGADAVVVASAQRARQFQPCADLPTRAIRGQISYLAADPDSGRLRTAICGDGYIAPATAALPGTGLTGAHHCAGATFDLHATDLGLREADHRYNLQLAGALSPTWARASQPPLAAGRASLRCTTPDYLPIVGPVPATGALLARFAPLRHDAKATIAHPGSYWPNLFVNIGHGSKGLNSTPICAALLADMLSGDCLPLPRSLALQLHPARFLIRDLIRKRR